MNVGDNYLYQEELHKSNTGDSSYAESQDDHTKIDELQ